MKSIKSIAVLGSTGSIGTSSLDVLSRFPGRFSVQYLTAHRNIELLRTQIEQFHPRGVVILDDECAARMRTELNGRVEVLGGEAGLREIVTRDDVDIVISGLVGFAGLMPTWWALNAGKHVALANKETLVVGGRLIMDLVRKRGARLLPIDSEHSAILQCLEGEQSGSVRRLLLTASGGPFLHLPHNQFDNITRAQALRHPTWRMGNKITIDSATLMNKGLEVIEAHWLFDIPAENIDVVIHPQSIVHSMVEFVDGSVKAQMGMPDMKLPIQYALTYPDRPASTFSRLDIASVGQMTFAPPDLAKFRCLPLAYRALAMGGTAPAVLNAANEVAVELFLADRLPFSAIPAVIEEALESHVPLKDYTIDDLIKIDSITRLHATERWAAATEHTVVPS